MTRSAFAVFLAALVLIGAGVYNIEFNHARAQEKTAAVEVVAKKHTTAQKRIWWDEAMAFSDSVKYLIKASGLNLKDVASVKVGGFKLLQEHRLTSGTGRSWEDLIEAVPIDWGASYGYRNGYHPAAIPNGMVYIPGGTTTLVLLSKEDRDFILRSLKEME